MKNDTIGVDVSKDHLDAHRPADGATRRFANDKGGLAETPANRVLHVNVAPLLCPISTSARSPRDTIAARAEARDIRHQRFSAIVSGRNQRMSEGATCASMRIRPLTPRQRAHIEEQRCATRSSFSVACARARESGVREGAPSKPPLVGSIDPSAVRNAVRPSPRSTHTISRPQSDHGRLFDAELHVRRTQKPLSSLWKVTRSTRPARTSCAGARESECICRRSSALEPFPAMTRNRLRGFIPGQAIGSASHDDKWAIGPHAAQQPRRPRARRSRRYGVVECHAPVLRAHAPTHLAARVRPGCVDVAPRRLR
jgi:hypothetical protein